jgi:hypothetical protein
MAHHLGDACSAWNALVLAVHPDGKGSVETH